jgi:hypothetical protein
MLVGISGKKNTGKTTVAARLTGAYGFSSVSFADPMKEGLATIFGVDVSVFHSQALKEVPLPELLGVSPRHLMQTLGTEWGRTCVSPTMWVRLLSRKVVATTGHVVVPDVRFDDEAQAIIKLGGVIWGVEGHHGAVDDRHVSEAGVSPSLVHLAIPNNGSIEELHILIDEALARGHTRPHQGKTI